MPILIATKGALPAALGANVQEPIAGRFRERVMMRDDLPPPDVVLSGRFEPGAAKRYVHRPFAVPTGVHQLHVRYAYSERIGSDPTLLGGNTLDIGLFDEQGIAAGSPGFRGWSGSERLAFTIDQVWATPPYRPGPIGAGTWHVLLGPYKVSPRGLGYEVRMWFNLGLPPEERTYLRQGRSAPADVPPAVERGWVRGDLHCHTLHSDGDSWPAEMLSAAAEAGLDFLGVTDHNGANHHADYGPGGDGLPVVIPGVEVTTYGGHWNAWGTGRWYDFRDPSPAAVEAAMRAAATDGAFVSVCHPKPFGPPWEYPTARGYHAIEVWNGPWELFNAAALGVWEAHLSRGERIAALGGSDTHRLRPSGEPRRNRLGQPTTWVQVDGPLTPRTVLDGLRAGRCFVSASPAGAQLYLRQEGAGVRVRVAGAPGAVVLLYTEAGGVAAADVTAEDWTGAFAVPGPARYVRAQIVDAHGSLLALTNPLWMDAA